MSNVVDYDAHTAVFRTPELLFTAQFAPRKYNMYGKGFSVFFQGMQLPYEHVNRTDLPTKIRAREFDLVVLAAGHVGNHLQWPRPPYMDDVCKAYDRSSVAFVWGHDRPIHKDHMLAVMNCSQHIFSREIVPAYLQNV